MRLPLNPPPEGDKHLSHAGGGKGVDIRLENSCRDAKSFDWAHDEVLRPYVRL